MDSNEISLGIAMESLRNSEGFLFGVPMYFLRESLGISNIFLRSSIRTPKEFQIGFKGIPKDVLRNCKGFPWACKGLPKELLR